MRLSTYEKQSVIYLAENRMELIGDDQGPDFEYDLSVWKGIKDEAENFQLSDENAEIVMDYIEDEVDFLQQCIKDYGHRGNEETVNVAELYLGMVELLKDWDTYKKGGAK